MTVLRQLWGIVERRERWQVVCLGAVMVVMGALETLGVASVMPFMELASEPDRIIEGHLLTPVFEAVGSPVPEQFLLYTGFALLAVITLNNAFNALTVWLIYRFAWSQNHRLSKRLLARYLSRPYEYFLPRNTAALGKNVLQEVNSVVQGVLLAVLRIAARAIVAVLILALLAWVDVGLTLIVVAVLGGAYGLIYAVLRRRQQRLGEVRLAENSERFRVSQEALGGIKDVKALGREPAFLERFQGPSWRYSRATAANQVAVRLPRYALETLAFGGVVVVLLYHIRVTGGVAQVLPMLSLFAFAAYRLMPALNELFGAAMQVRFNAAALTELSEDLEALSEPPAAPPAGTVTRDTALREAIELHEVVYRYPNAEEPALRGVSLRIERHAVVGLVGETGCGKTTLIDLILGLLAPTSGSLLVDGRPVRAGSAAAWRSACGYVPQDIYLSDDSVEANIAFGIRSEEVDPEQVRRAARMARIDRFVQSLPAGYDTVVGERGVRLSGGQRQRIGIARALYHEPEVLLLDEATSSLDGATEGAVLDTIQTLSGSKTLVIVAHRLTTVQACEAIHVLDGGRIVATGTYAELARNDRRFRRMAGLEAAGGV